MKAVVIVEVAVIAAMAWAVHLVRRPFEFQLDPVSFDRLPVIGLALALGTVVAVGLWGARHRLPPRAVVIALGALAVTAVLGATRVEPLASRAEAVAVACWLAGAAPVLAVGVLASRTVPSPPTGPLRTGLGVIVLLGLVVAALGMSASPVSPVDPGAAGRGALAAQLAALLTVVGWLAAVTWRDASPATRRALVRDPVVITVLAWTATAAWERAVPLLPLSDYLLVARGGYRPWSLASALYLPLLTTIAVVIAVGWCAVVRPRVERLADGVVVVTDHDPLAALRDDLAAWTGDPTLQLAYADEAGRWVSPTGESPPDEAAYDRARTVVTHGGRAIGMIDHDLALAQDPDALQTAAAMAGVAFHANQLLALSEVRLAATRDLGRRILLADATTQDSVRAELEAGALQRLTDTGRAVRDGAPIADVVNDLQEITAEVRDLSHGLYPPELAAGGLRSVLGDRPGVPGRRLPAAVEITAFLVADGDPACRFDDRGTALGIHRARPVVDDLLLGRIGVLGGAVTGCSVTIPVPAP